ncbi:MAG: PASTA domain-containing protein, partial [Bacteroidota bacterium]|nr:PASTA domain-containing protein [Bacteroidota bacterium]
MFRFITRQPFWVNLLAAMALVALLVFLFLQSLSWITNHGSYLKVPSVVGQPADQAIKSLEDKGFQVVITDSIYDETLPLNTVKKQVPDSGATVKVNRTVFLNINPVTLPMVSVPKLEGLSLRFAIDRLQKNHLRLGDTTSRPDFMQGTVLEQDYQGSKIAPGAKLQWGSPVNLVIGAGLSQQQIPVPELYGLTLADAKAVLAAKGITLAAVLASGPITDTLKAFVFKQNPDLVNDEGAPNYIQGGQTMDLWITATQP